MFAAAVAVIFDVIFQYYFRLKGIGVENYGVSFGVGKGTGTVISLLVVSILALWIVYEKVKRNRDHMALNLILIGGLGNLVCRLLWGSVWDYVCFSFMPFCFNLSDVLISIGVVSYILGDNGNRSSV